MFFARRPVALMVRGVRTTHLRRLEAAEAVFFLSPATTGKRSRGLAIFQLTDRCAALTPKCAKTRQGEPAPNTKGGHLTTRRFARSLITSRLCRLKSSTPRSTRRCQKLRRCALNRAARHPITHGASSSTARARLPKSTNVTLLNGALRYHLYFGLTEIFSDRKK